MTSAYARMARSWLLTGMMAIALLAFAGCGDDDEGDTGGGAAATTTEAAAPEAAEPEAAAGPTVEDLTGEGSFEAEPPTEGPPPATGKSVWWVSCGMSLPACAVPANAAKEAASTLGVKFQIADGKLNVGGGNANAVRTALAAKPDMLLIHGISCPGIRQPLSEAKRAGVKVMGVEALDCDDPPDTGDNLFSAEMKYSPKAESSIDYFRAWGQITAQYLIAATGGKTKYIYNILNEPLGLAIDSGFEEEIKKCSGCEQLEKIESLSSDGVPNSPWTQRLRPALLKNPTADAIIFPVDSLVSGAGGARIAKEVIKDIKGYGGSGESTTLDLVRQGTMTAATGAHDAEWMGWAAIDNANRALQDEPTVPQGVGFRPVDKDHNLPETAGDGYKTPIDYKAAYERLWAGAG